MWFGGWFQNFVEKMISPNSSQTESEAIFKAKLQIQTKQKIENREKFLEGCKQKFKNQIKEINNLIQDYNLLVPMSRQLYYWDPDHEIQNIFQTVKQKFPNDDNEQQQQQLQQQLQQQQQQSSS